MISRSKTWVVVFAIPVSVLAVAATFPAVAERLVVAKTGAQFGSIQSAMNSANPGDTVQVREGTYYENLSVDKDLTLKGVGASKVKIDGQKEGYPVLYVGPSEVEVTVKGLSLQGAEGDSCKDLEKGLYPDGVAATGDSKLRVKGVTISGNEVGIRLGGSARATVEESRITGNSRYGIGLGYSARVTVENNKISENGELGIGLVGSARATVKNNKISGNEAGIELRDSAQATVKNNKISGNELGIGLRNSAQVTVENNKISENGELGVGLLDSAQATVKNNKISGNRRTGIGLRGSAQTTVKNNKISGNGRRGIALVDSAQVTVDNSDVKENFRGIVLGGSSQATVGDSEITGNEQEGIALGYSARAAVQNNSIRKNNIGIGISEPEKFKGSLEGTGNRIVDNDTNFAGVSESTRKELASEPTVKTSGVPYSVTYKGPEFTIKDKEGKVLGTGTVSITTTPYWPSNDYKIVDYAVGNVDADGTKEVVLIARHVKWYPGQVYVVETDGSEISRYWNPGFVYSLKLYDIEDDGAQEILVGATNNDKKNNFNVPAVFALDARTMKGEAPPRYGSFGSGAEIWYTFPDLTRGAGIRSLSISEGSLVATTGDGTQYTLRLSDGKVMSSSS